LSLPSITKILFEQELVLVLLVELELVLLTC
jgi:hypothetical protein